MSDYLIEARSSISTFVIKVELLDKDENVIREITDAIIGGDVSRDFQIGSRASANLTIDNGEGDYSLDPNTTATSKVWLDNKFRVYTGLEINGVSTFFSQGIFVIGEYNEVTSTSTTSTASYTLWDKFSLLDGTRSGVIVNSFIIPNGTNASQAVRIVLQHAQDEKIPIAYDVKGLIGVNTTETIQKEIYVDAGRTYFDVLNEICRFINYTIFFDKNGYPNFVPVSVPEDEASILELGEDDILVANVDKRFLVKDIRNSVRTTSDDWGNGVIYDFTAENNEPTSELRIDRIGLISEYLYNDLLSTETQAEDTAEYFLDLHSRVLESANLTILPLDNIDEGEIIEVTKSAVGLDAARMQINQINIPLFKRGTATINASRTVKL